MTLCINTNSVHPHMAPMAAHLKGLLPNGAFRYFYHGKPADSYRATGACGLVDDVAELISESDSHNGKFDSYDVLVENRREFDVIERHLSLGKVVFYQSERWFKPIGGTGFLSGFLRVLMPFGIKRAIRMMRLFRSPRFVYLPIGISAARDMARLCGLMNGDLKCFFRAPKLDFERCPGGRIWALNGKDDLYCLDKMRMWGYFVSPSSLSQSNCRTVEQSDNLRILWVGRMLDWKRIDTIIKAVGGQRNMSLDLFGAGPEADRLKRLANRFENIHFKGLVPLAEVRQQMREHDVYVLSSNAFEGWGAVVCEALEEGMKVVGTYEAGASATILMGGNLYHVGDWRRLRCVLSGPMADGGIGAWTAEKAAMAILDLAREMMK